MERLIGSAGVFLLCIATASAQHRQLGKHQGVVQIVAFSPDGTKVASGGHEDRTVRLWDVATGKELHCLTGHGAPVEGVTFSPDGKTLVSSGLQEAIRTWDVASGKEVQRINAQGHPFGVAISPDGKTLGTSGQDRTARLWSAATGKQLHALGGHNGRVWGLAFSPDGKVFASGCEDGVVRLWDRETGKELHALDGHGPSFCPVAFSPDGKTVATGAADRRVRLWEASTGKERLRLDGTNQVLSVAFSPDGRTLAAGFFQDATIRLWEVATGQPVLDLEGHRLFVPSVAFAPDGRTLVSGGRDGEVRLWDVTGRAKGGKLLSAEWTPRELDSLWEDLNGTDAKKAYRATWALAASPRQTVALFKDRLRPAEDGKDVDKLIARHIRDLDDPRFGVRDRASHLLGKQGRRAEKALRKALDEETSAEVRSRVKVLLEKLEGTAPAAEAGPQARAAAVLERLGTPEARQLLKDLARGDSRLADEARASLSRIDKK